MRSILIVAAFAVGCDSSSEPNAARNVPVRLEAVTATQLTGTVGDQVPKSPAVRAVNATGRAVAGVDILFLLDDGSGTNTNRLVRTDDQGIATYRNWVLGATIGPHTLIARHPEVADVVFTALVSAARPAKIERLSGDNQTGAPGQPLAAPLSVRITDHRGNPIPGLSVRFAAEQDGSFANALVRTDAKGIATSGLWTLGTTVGEQTAWAQIDGMGIDFSAFASGVAAK